MPLLILALAAATVATQQPGSEPLASTGPWVVNAEDNLCLLSHSFGGEPERVTIGFQPMFLQRSMEVIVLRPDRSSAERRGKATVTFGQDGTTFTAQYVSFPIPGKNTRLFRLTVDAKAFDELKTAATLSIHAPPLDATVRLPKAGKALAAFTSCQTDLLQSWGVDPAFVEPSRAPELRGNPAQFFGGDAYPAEAIRAGQSGRAVAVLKVDTNGGVADCRIVVTAGKPLNDATCVNARRIMFRPPVDSAGRPAASIYVLAVRWVLPGS